MVAKSVSFSKRLKDPPSTVRASFGGTTPFKVTLDVALSKGKVSDFGFKSDGRSESVELLNKACSLFLGKTQEECEGLDLTEFVESVNVSADNRPMAIFVWNLIQDGISRLPFNDPMSKMINRISKWHDEFPLGDPKADEED